MKKSILFSLVLAMLFMNFTCEDDKQPVQVTTSEELIKKKQAILDYIAGFSCNETVGCKFLAFGEKGCGGPKEYLIFPANVDLNFLTAKVTEYNALEKQFNIDNDIVSDCMFVMPPTNVGCVNGKCVIIP